MTKLQFIQEVLHKAFWTVHPNVSKNGQAPNHVEEGKFSDEQEKIKNILSSPEPCFIGRYGSIELDAFCNYLQIHGLIKPDYSPLKYISDQCWPNWWSIGAKHGLSNNAGFFPVNDSTLDKWGGIMLDATSELTHLLWWQRNEKYVEPFCKSLCDKINNSQLYNPMCYPNPWTKVLENKRVLVVSPFKDTIVKQYEKREHLFKNQDVLPKFNNLYVVKAFNFLGGHSDGSIKDWFEALEIMERQIAKYDFDIALLGCGAYAFPLGAYIKNKLSKKAVTQCGSLQILFGITGVRYDERLQKKGFLNDYWVRPSEDERPLGYEKVENGAYW